MSDDLTPPGPPLAPRPAGEPERVNPYGGPTVEYPAHPQPIGQVPPGPYGPPYGSPYGRAPQGPPPSKAYAWTGMVLAILPLCITPFIGLYMSIRTLVKCGDGRDHGKTPAIVGIVFGAIWSIVIALGVVGYFLPDQSSSTGSGPTQVSTPARIRANLGRPAPTPTAGTLHSHDLAVGDCIDSPLKAGHFSTAHAVPCTHLHDAVVFAVYDLAAGTPVHRVPKVAEKGCQRRTSPTFMHSPMARGLHVFTIYPATGAQLIADPSVHCIYEIPRKVRSAH